MYYIAAERFGWTPTQVDDLPANTADWLLAIAALVDEVKANRMERS
jgi:hypothetical protein